MKKNISYRFFQFLCSIPILLWPITYFLSIFVFDDPTANIKMQWAVFITLNIYPVFCIVALILSNKKYKTDEETANALVVAPFVLYIFGFILLFALG